MEVQFGPNAEDEPKLQYKLQKKIKVFNCDSLPNRGYNLVACASKYAIVFVASPDGVLLVYRLNDLINKEIQTPSHLTIKLPEKPTHIAVSCDFELLVVTGGQLINVYNVQNFQNQNTQPSASIQTGVSSTTIVSSLQWNPCVPDTLAISFFDGTLLVSQVSTGQVIKIQAKARCVCWSPKGKQIVVGNSDGTLCQYKPDLTPAKSIHAPNLFEGAPVETLAVHWVSTYQFAVVYRDSTGGNRPCVTIVNTPKAGQASCQNYDDICYSLGSTRPWYYYLAGVAQWNIILASSSNSMEIATLGSTDSTKWVHWCQLDEARPELPLTDKKQENYPVGICFDTCAIHQLPWGESETLPHMPLLHMVSHSGLLTIFNVINFKTDIQICAPPQQIVLPAAAMTMEIPGAILPAYNAAPPVMPASELPTLQSSSPALQFPQPAIPEVAPVSQYAMGPLPNVAINIPSFSAPPPNVSVAPQSKIPNVKTQDVKQSIFEQPPAVQFPQPAIPEVASVTQYAMGPLPNVAINIPSFSAPPPNISVVPQSKIPDVKTQEVKQSILQQAQTTAQTPKPQVASPVQNVTVAPTQEFNSNNLKIDQEKASEKLNQELKSMLIKEVNDFQMELYKFMQKSNVAHIKVSEDLNSIKSNVDLQAMNTEKLKRECSLEELHLSVVQLKLELVRTCAVVAEARTHSESKDQYTWNQIDPLSTKRLDSIKKLAYYIQNQLDQAQKALDYKWNEVLRDPNYKRPSGQMIRPILHDVYQPLVKQQEILSRQQAMLKTFRSTLKECEMSPMWKSKPILRSTPFRNKDPLSKLTKNILNMSLDSATKASETKLSPQKLDALKDMLANHKTVKIKPVNIELRQHLAAMRINYEKSLKVKASESQTQVEAKPQVPPAPVFRPTAPTPIASKPDVVREISPVVLSPMLDRKPMTAPVNVVRTLFTEELQKEKVPISKPIAKPTPTFGYNAQTANMTTPTVNTQSVLKDLLQKKNTVAVKNDSNTFMGQKICSPTLVAPAPASKTPFSTIFSGKQSTSGIFSQSKFPMGQATQSKPPTTTSNVKSAETGEPEDIPKDTLDKPIGFSIKPSNDAKPSIFTANTEFKVDKPILNIPSVKPLAQNVPDVLNTNNVQVTIVRNTDAKTKHENKPTESKPVVEIKPKIEVLHPVLKLDVSKKEPETPKQVVTQSEINKSVSSPTTTATVTSVAIKLTETKTDSPKPPVTPESPTASALFASANAAVTVSAPKSPRSIFGSPPTSPSTSIFGSSTSPLQTTSIFGMGNSKSTESTPNASSPTTQTTSIFGASVTSSQALPSTPSPSVSPAQPSFEPAKVSVPSSSNSATPTTTQSSIFGSPSSPTTTPSSIFATSPAGQPSPSAIFGAAASATPQSLFAAPKPEVSQASVFGSPTPTAQPSAFTTPTTTQVSIFGTAVATTQSSPFGTPTTTPSSVFGSPTTQASIFGAASPPTTQSMIFGVPPATTDSAASIFGGAENNLFAAASLSTTSAPTRPNAGNIFGGSNTASSVFGSSGSSVFATKPAFGQSNATASIFGGGATIAQGATSNPWAGNTAGSTFGSGFGQPNQSASVFGGGGGSFSTPSSGQPFSAPTAGSPGAATNQASVFGSPPQQSAAFGGSVFGSKSAFGQPPSYGGPPGGGSAFGSFGGFNKSPSSGFGGQASFGGSATFGSTSPSKAFGTTPPGFGAQTQANATFENLATQNTLTFGNLAQSAQQQATPSSFNTSPSFTGWRG